MPEPNPPEFTAPIALLDMLTGARLALVAGAPSKVLTFVESALVKLEAAAVQHARILDTWSREVEGQEIPWQPGDTLTFMSQYEHVADWAPSPEAWAYGARRYRGTCATRVAA